MLKIKFLEITWYVVEKKLLKYMKITQPYFLKLIQSFVPQCNLIWAVYFSSL